MSESSTLMLASFRKNEDGGVKITHYRGFTAEEVKEYEQHMQAYVVARERFKLLHIVARNFAEFKNALDAHVIDMTELDRLLLNFLSSCYALRSHLDAYVKRTHGHNSPQTERLTKLFEELVAKNASFKFFQEARSCAQHAAMLIDDVAVRDTDTGKKVSLSSNVERLRKFDRRGDWSFADSDTVDLIATAQEYHNLIINRYAGELVRLFGEAVFNAHNYCARLYDDAKCTDTLTSAIIIHKAVHSEFPGGDELQMSFKIVPRDVFGELGLQCSVRNEAPVLT